MLREFTPDDLWRIVPQAAQAMDRAARERIVSESVPRGPCWTACERSGRIVGVGGFVYVHPQWATAWTILAERIGTAMPGLTRAVAQRLRAEPAARIDMHVDPAQPASARWARLLGFRLECWMDRALPDGRDMAVWLYEGEYHG